MIYTFECKRCGKIKLCNSKDEYQIEKNKHWVGKGSQKRHTPILQTCHLEMRTSKKSGRPYAVFITD